MSRSWLSPFILLKSSDIWPQLWQARPSAEPETHVIIYISAAIVGNTKVCQQLHRWNIIIYSKICFFKFQTKIWVWPSPWPMTREKGVVTVDISENDILQNRVQFPTISGSKQWPKVAVASPKWSLNPKSWQLQQYSTWSNLGRYCSWLMIQSLKRLGNRYVST